MAAQGLQLVLESDAEWQPTVVPGGFRRRQGTEIGAARNVPSAMPPAICLGFCRRLALVAASDNSGRPRRTFP
jgi:hypothetical protein